MRGSRQTARGTSRVVNRSPCAVDDEVGATKQLPWAFLHDVKSSTRGNHHVGRSPRSRAQFGPFDTNFKSHARDECLALHARVWEEDIALPLQCEAAVPCRPLDRPLPEVSQVRTIASLRREETSDSEESESEQDVFESPDWWRGTGPPMKIG